MTPYTIQNILECLSKYWAQHDCVIHESYDLEMGAGTFHPATFLRCLGPEPYRAAYAEPCRRPTDGRYGENPNRMQHYFQFQVIIKPSPLNFQELYLGSLEAVGIQLKEHDIRFVYDDWESPTLGAWGLGWEVWCDGMEVTQYTYFQAVAGIPMNPVTGELTYGIERLAMYLQGVDSAYDLKWNERLSYGDLFKRNEWEFSHYNFNAASTDMWRRHFDDYEKEAHTLIDKKLPLPAYDFVMKASHAFNILDARGVISVTERTGYIQRVRDLACLAAQGYLESREAQKFPLLKHWPTPTQDSVLPSPVSTTIDEDPSHSDDFLLEIGSEELPADFVPLGCKLLKKAMIELLERIGLKYGKVETTATPRRLAIRVQGLARAIEKQTEERRGPSTDAAFDKNGLPTKAGQGFFRSIGLDPLSRQDIDTHPQLSIQSVKNKDYLFAITTKKDFHTATWRNLQEHLPSLILNLDFPKKMRWADLEISYARPLRWIVALHGSDIIHFQLGPLHSGRHSFGHRQLNPTTFLIPHPKDYIDTLRDHKVMVDIEERKKHIEDQLKAIEEKLHYKTAAREQVLAQVLHLSEWPTLTEATFESAFLRAPKEVLISEMVEHQKYFPLAQEDGTLTNYFIITADNIPSDIIRHGNQKVLSARLSDGTFLYDQDLKTPLEEWNKKLKYVTFQKQLGSIYDKVQRLIAHCTVLNPEDSQLARAALLCKADLATDMVGEFPELQGTIGKYYALAHNESPTIANAIEEHYQPRGEQAPLPTSDTGAFLSLAEKIDNLLGCFLAGLKPKSSSDPYGLRRQVLAIIRILIEKQWHLPLKDTLRLCAKHFPTQLLNTLEDTLEDIETFITNRIKTVFQAYELDKDEIEASLSSHFNDIYDSYRKTQALHEIRHNNPSFPLLLEVHKRAKGQLEGKAPQTLDSTLLKEPAEITLHQTLTTITPDFQNALTQKDYQKAYLLLTTLQPPLHELFETVHILDPNPSIQNNRIALLQNIFKLFQELLDLSLLKGSKGFAPTTPPGEHVPLDP